MLILDLDTISRKPPKVLTLICILLGFGSVFDNYSGEESGLVRYLWNPAAPGCVHCACQRC